MIAHNCKFLWTTSQVGGCAYGGWSLEIDDCNQIVHHFCVLINKIFNLASVSA